MELEALGPQSWLVTATNAASRRARKAFGLIIEWVGWTAGGPSGDQMDLITLRGSLAGSDGRYYGIVLRMANDAEPVGGGDPAAVRGIIGTVQANGRGSVRFLHAHATGSPTATGPVSAINAQVTACAGVSVARNIEVAVTGPSVEGWDADPGQAVTGIAFTASAGGRFGYMLNALATPAEGGFAQLGHGIPGRIVWGMNVGINSPASGVLRLDYTALQGPLQDRLTALEARVTALEP